MTKTPVFKTSGGVYYLKQLFYELATDTDRPFVLYTLKDSDWKGYPSLRRLYLEMADESEYNFATAYFDGWPHYQRLLATSWFNDYMSGYREELRLKTLATALFHIKDKAKTGDFQANKYILSEEWKGAKKSNVGRPTKARIKEEADKMFQDKNDIQDDLDRLRGDLNLMRA